MRTENTSGETEIMTVTAEMVRDEMSETVVSLKRPDEKLKGLYRRLSWLFDPKNELGITAGQIKRLHHKEWKEIPGYVVDTIRLRAKAARAERDSAIALEKNELAELRRELEIVKERLGVADMDFHRPAIEALEQGKHAAGRQAGERR